MKKLLYILVLVLVLTGCGKMETDNSKQVKIEEEQKTAEEDVTSEKEILDAPATEDSQSTADAPVVQEPSNNTSSNNDTTTGTNNTGANNSGSTTKPSTGSTGNSGSANSGSTGNTSNNNSGTTTQPVHEHKWIEVTEDEIHYYAWRTICGKCKTDMTDMTDDEAVYHSAIICNSRYSTKYIEVNFVTENIVKTPVVTGYKCECGAEKK